MAVAKKKTPAKRRRRRRTVSKTTPVRRRRRTTKKKGLGDLFSRSDAEAGFKQLVGVGAGYIAGESLTDWINPDGENDQLEIIAKIGGGFLMSTTGRMPSIGAGLMASGVKKVWEIKQLGDNGKKANYLNGAPKMINTGVRLNDSEMEFLSENYRTGYESNYY